MAHELLILAPQSADGTTRLAVDEKIAYLVMNGIDFAFDDDYCLPEAVPNDLLDYRAALIFMEDFEHHAAALGAFPDAAAVVAAQRTTAYRVPCRTLRHPQTGTQLFLRSVGESAETLEQVFWQADLTLAAAAMKRRLLALPDDHVIERFLRNYEPEHRHRYVSRWTTFVNERFETEQAALQTMFLFDLAQVTGQQRFIDRAMEAVSVRFADLNPDHPLLFAGNWSFNGAFAAAYQATGEEKYLMAAMRGIDCLYAHFERRNGCFGNQAYAPWPRDSVIFVVAVPMLKIALLCDEPRRGELLDQVARQFLGTEKFMRDPDTGLYRFGGDERGLMPTQHGHGNQWQAMGFAQILGLFPTTHRDYARMREIFADLMAALVRYQTEDGFWHQVLDRPELSYGDMLYTPAFVGALYRGLTYGLLDDSFREPASRGWEACKTRLWDGCVSGISGGVGYSKNPRYFYSRLQRQDFRACMSYTLYAILEKYRAERKGC